MALLKKAKKEGISLRTIHGWLVILAVITCGLLIASTFYSFATFRHLSEATDDYIELQKAAYELMNASDARELFTQADRALYESKRRGRCDFTFFTGEAGA